jgi:hypothetical protein
MEFALRPRPALGRIPPGELTWRYQHDPMGRLVAETAHTVPPLPVAYNGGSAVGILIGIFRVRTPAGAVRRGPAQGWTPATVPTGRSRP